MLLGGGRALTLLLVPAAAVLTNPPHPRAAPARETAPHAAALEAAHQAHPLSFHVDSSGHGAPSKDNAAERHASASAGVALLRREEETVLGGGSAGDSPGAIPDEPPEWEAVVEGLWTVNTRAKDQAAVTREISNCKFTSDSVGEKECQVTGKGLEDCATLHALFEGRRYEMICHGTKFWASVEGGTAEWNDGAVWLLKTPCVWSDWADGGCGAAAEPDKDPCVSSQRLLTRTIKRKATHGGHCDIEANHKCVNDEKCVGGQVKIEKDMAVFTEEILTVATNMKSTAKSLLRAVKNAPDSERVEKIRTFADGFTKMAEELPKMFSTGSTDQTELAAFTKVAQHSVDLAQTTAMIEQLAALAVEQNQLEQDTAAEAAAAEPEVEPEAEIVSSSSSVGDKVAGDVGVESGRGYFKSGSGYVSKASLAAVALCSAALLL